ncbi:sialidase [Flavobacteriaceae bacterium]|jgi:hypothetical protein|nr:sialidase [Flavobacteriaceae bacterium]
MESLQNISSYRKLLICFFVVSLLLFYACISVPSNSVIVLEVPTSGINNSEPNLHHSETGDLYLSWVESYDANNNALRLSKISNKGWSNPKLIAQGQNWFVNWADFPAIVTFGESNIAAHYLEKSADDTYAYDVKLIQSTDGGESWQKSFKPHNDNTNTEHGFVSKLAVDNDTYIAAWLDGRQHALAEIDSTINKRMTLRSALINSKGTLLEEHLIDDSVCDCCQTDIAMTKEGPIVVYRNRTDNEIRDIYYSKKVHNLWTEPKPIFNDNWTIAGCPVNGPAISAKDNKVVVSWFTMANDIPKVNIAFSNNNGSTFNEPIEIISNSTMGRLDVELLNNGNAIVSSMNNNLGTSEILLHYVTPQGKVLEPLIVSETTNTRSSGFPRMAIHDNKIYMAWTSTEDNLKVQSAEISIIDFNK